MYAAGSVRPEKVTAAPIIEPTDAIIRLSARNDRVAESYRAIGERRAIQTLLVP